jgi:hypothetical protein
MKLLEQKIESIDDPAVLALIQELSLLTNVPAHTHWMLWTFLTQCLYPFGSDRRYKLAKDDLNPAGILIQRVGKLQGTAIFEMCEEVARKSSQSAELYVNHSLYVFLNKLLPDIHKKPQKHKFHPRDINRLFGDQS